MTKMVLVYWNDIKICALGVLLGILAFSPIIAQTEPSAFASSAEKDSVKFRDYQSFGKSNHDLNELLAKAENYISHQPDSSLQYARSALRIATQEENSQGIARSNLLLGHIFANFSAYSTAADHFYTAIELFITDDNWVGQAETHNALGDLYYYTRQLSESLNEHQKALKIARDNDLSRLEALTLGYIGHFYEKQLDYTKALEFQLQALQLYEQLGEPNGLSAIYGNLGSIYEDLEDYDRAYEYFSLALEYNEQTQNEEQRIVHLNNLGDSFRKRGRLKEALRYSQEAEALAGKLENIYQTKSAKRDLSKTYFEMGEYRDAYLQAEAAYELVEELYDTGAVTQIARMQSVYEMNQTLRELDNLKKDQRISRIVSWSVIGGLLMIIVVSALLFSRQRLKNRKDREILEARQALTERELENSQLREKQLQADLEARASQLSAHALSIVQKNKILKEIKSQLTHMQQQNKSMGKPVSQLVNKIDQSFHFDKDWKKFNHIFEQVHPEFYRRLNDKYPDLTSAEIRLCALLRLNLEAKDIASILGISQDSLRVSRYRLRKKLELERNTNLVSFIMNI